MFIILINRYSNPYVALSTNLIDPNTKMNTKPFYDFFSAKINYIKGWMDKSINPQQRMDSGILSVSSIRLVI